MLLNCRCWRRLLRVSWTAKRSNSSILKEISPEYSLKGLMLKLKLQYFGHLMWRTSSLEKTLMLGKTESRRRWRHRRDGGMPSQTQWTWVWANFRRWWRTRKTGVLYSSWSGKELDTTEGLNNNNQINSLYINFVKIPCTYVFLTRLWNMILINMPLTLPLNCSNIIRTLRERRQNSKEIQNPRVTKQSK